MRKIPKSVRDYLCNEINTKNIVPFTKFWERLNFIVLDKINILNEP